MSMRWNKAYLVGNATIDNQHRNLFKLCNKFLETDLADKKALTSCAVELYKYTRDHFEQEEAFMKQIDYPQGDYKLHCAEHTGLITYLNSISAQIASGSINTKAVEDFVKAWLINHVAKFDMNFITYAAIKETR